MNRIPGKYGRTAPQHTLRTVRAGIALYKALAGLGTAPATSDDYVSAVHAQAPNGWGAFLNDHLGDCVPAGSAHQLMLHTANGGKIIIPTDDDVLAMYEAVGGYVPGNSATDRGCDEGIACRWLETTGLCGQKSAGTGFVDPARLDLIRWTVQIFGACRLGISVTDDMEQAFADEQPWEDFKGTIRGGHDVPIVAYDASAATVVTWGEEQVVSWRLLANASFLGEAHAEVWPDFIRATGNTPAGFDLKQLLADLPQVTQVTPTSFFGEGN